MGTVTTLDYWLPRTKITLQATVTESTDTIVATGAPARTAERTFGYLTQADDASPRRLEVTGGLLRDYSLQVGLTDDGRLTSATAENTGRVGQILAAGATLAGAALALATGNVPLAVILGTAAGGSRDQPLGIDDGGDGGSDEPETPEQQVWRAYQAAHAVPAERLTNLTKEHDALVRALDEARSRLRQKAGDVWASNTVHQEVATLKVLLADNEVELDRANQHFAAWRAGTITTTTIRYDELVDVESLPRLTSTGLQFGDDSESVLVQEFFKNTGGILARVDENGADLPEPQTQEEAGGRSTDRLYARRPRRVSLAHVEGDGEVAPSLLSVDRVLVMDGTCPEVAVPLRRSWFGRRHTSITLSELGAIAAVDFNGEASASTTAQALSGLPAAFGAGLESVATSRSKLDELATAPQVRELAALERAVDLQTKRLELAGQSATATDYVELQRLKQEKEIAELRAALTKLRT